MLLARQGQRVLLLDRDRYGTDTMSTHALMRTGVFLLNQWGLLDAIVRAGTPPVRRTRFDYGDETVTVPIKRTPGVEALYAPRRTVLDTLLVDAAAAAGAEIRFGVSVTGLLRDDAGRVVGVRGRDRTGCPVVARARLIVGADGLRSTVASAAGAATLRIGSGAGAVIYGYWSDLPVDGYEWFYRTDHSAGLIPTNDGEVCVFAGTPAQHLGRVGGDLGSTYRLLLDAATDGAGGRFDDARPPRRLRTWLGSPSIVRQAYGSGWVLVGDAGSFFDPLTTHGITDALRDAGLLARSLGEADVDTALRRYAEVRDQIVGSMFDVVDRIAGYGWNLAQLQRLLFDQSAAARAELEVVGPLVGEDGPLLQVAADTADLPRGPQQTVTPAVGCWPTG
jgi:2-polyprenyl-6-methoxyphenol hydroxylase-like FAD-dependent oxidoreductase